MPQIHTQHGRNITPASNEFPETVASQETAGAAVDSTVGQLALRELQLSRHVLPFRWQICNHCISAFDMNQ
jgi:hypothetical protein